MMSAKYRGLPERANAIIFDFYEVTFANDIAFHCSCRVCSTYSSVRIRTEMQLSINRLKAHNLTTFPACRNTWRNFSTFSHNKQILLHRTIESLFLFQYVIDLHV
jgi:hypothetical protein